MRHVKAYVKWLSDKALLKDLVPADVPRGRIKAKLPNFLTKEDMTAIFQYLELNLANAKVDGNQKSVYDALLWRAVIWLLYTSGLRNFELRGLTYPEININQLFGTVLGK